MIEQCKPAKVENMYCLSDDFGHRFRRVRKRFGNSGIYTQVGSLHYAKRPSLEL